MLVNGLTLVVMLWFAADGVGGRAPDPWIALFAFATMASFEILMPIAGAFQYLGQTLTSARRLNEVILAEPDVVFPELSKREENHWISSSTILILHTLMDNRKC